MSSSHPLCTPDAAPESYRAKVTSTVDVAALVYQPLPASGALLRVLRGSLYHKRGVRNVMEMVAAPVTPPTAADVIDAPAASSSASVRVDFHVPDTADVADLTPSATPTGAHRVMTGPCKVCLLDPAVLTPAGLCLPSDVSSNTTAVFTLGAGVAGCDVTQALASAVSARQLSTKAADLLQRLHAEVAGSTSTAAAVKSPSRKKAPFTGPVQVAFTAISVELTYKNYTMPELLSMVLPVQEESAVVALSGFEQVGHIAHVNLSAANVPYAVVIGQVILDCNETVDVVVNKAESISSVFREFKMHIIAERPNTFDENGERIRHDDDASGSSRGPALTTAEKELLALPAASTQTSRREARLNRMLTATVRQHGCNFRVPYNRVYWNSRLSFEHTRLVEAMHRGDRLFDVMAGVGPFAVPAAQNGVEVWANDLNPAAADYMKVNAELNHVPPSKMHVYNMDGRAFLNTVLFDSVMGLQAVASESAPRSGRRHVTMNLPAIAVEFLNVFQPLRSDGAPVKDDAGVAVNTRWNTLPAAAKEMAVDKHVLFHVYCFSAAEYLLADAVAQCEQHLGYTLPKENVEEVLMVRDVAPTKRMMCVSFTLPEAFWTHLFSSAGVEGGTALSQGSEPAAKKAKADSVE